MTIKPVMKLYKAKLHTGGKTAIQIKESFDGPEPSDKEVQNWIKAYALIDGLEIVIMESVIDGDYMLAGWGKKDDEKFKEFIYLAEQDPMVVNYNDDREQFENDWEAGEYEPSGSMRFDKNDIEIIEEIKNS